MIKHDIILKDRPKLSTFYGTMNVSIFIWRNIIIPCDDDLYLWQDEGSNTLLPWSLVNIFLQSLIYDGHFVKRSVPATFLNFNFSTQETRRKTLIKDAFFGNISSEMLMFYIKM